MITTTTPSRNDSVIHTSGNDNNRSFRRRQYVSRRQRMEERRQQLVHRREICVWIQGEDGLEYNSSSCMRIQPFVRKLPPSCMPTQLSDTIPEPLWNGFVDELNQVVPFLFREGILLQIAMYLYLLIWITMAILTVTEVILMEIFMIAFVIGCVFIVAWGCCVAQLEKTRDVQLRCILEDYNERFFVDLGWGVFLRSRVSIYSFFCHGGDHNRTNTPPKRAMVFKRVVSVDQLRIITGIQDIDIVSQEENDEVEREEAQYAWNGTEDDLDQSTLEDSVGHAEGESQRRLAVDTDAQANSIGTPTEV